MDTLEKYRKIYDNEMLFASKGVIITYNALLDEFLYQPISHNVEDDCIQQLSQLMRHSLFFYCYGEEEVIKHYENGSFPSLEMAAIYAYLNRAPKRQAKSDGLLGEVLIDMFIQIFEKDAYKLAVRPLLRQDDNTEIKGYDLTYFTLREGKIALWLGQAKLGQKPYCKTGILKELVEKYKREYLTKQLFFVCEKPSPMTKERREVVEIINKINRITSEKDLSERATSLLKCFKENDISINIPCLLAYEEGEVYNDVSNIQEKVKKQLEEMRDFYSKREYEFEGFEPNVILYIFPIKNIEELRDEKEGFYRGLR